MAKIIYCGGSLTVYRSGTGREAIVYGKGADWVLQWADVTNPAKPWRRWFSTRENAENAAVEMTRQATDTTKGGA